MTTEKYIKRVLKDLAFRNAGESEYFQAVQEVLESLIPALEKHPEYVAENVIERLVEPERVLMFRVPWVDGKDRIKVNRGYRVEFSSAIGPYKGGLRFHPSVNLSVLKFLGFEQIFKNSLTTLPMGAGKGGSDFDPKGKTDREVMSFCQSYMTELFRHIGPNTDIPAGDIGVGSREIGFLFGQYKRLRNEFTGVLTGKGINWGGSLIRPEATGYGLVYFVQHILQNKNNSFEGKVVAISGSGNVSQYAAQKATELGGKVVTMSDSSGWIHDPDGIRDEKLDFVFILKNERRGRLSEYAEKFGCAYHVQGRPWEIKCDIALPCATQNELDANDAGKLVANGVICVGEGANMPSTPEAIKIFKENNVLFGPAKAANAGGVATSGLEMVQDATHILWEREEVDDKLKIIMRKIYKQIREACDDYELGDDYAAGANIAGFMKVASSMLDQGVV